MANESLKKVAVLTGLTMVMGGAEISRADTMTSQGPFGFNLTTPQGQGFNATNPVAFTAFDSSQGMLDGAFFTLTTSSIDTGVTGTVMVFGQTFPSTGVTGTGPVTFGGSLPLKDFEMGAFTATEILTNNTEQNGSWNGNLSLTYDFTPATPLPASLPLLATGLGGLGLAVWRSRRKQKTASEG